MPRTESERLRIYGPPEYREWAMLEPCVVVGCETKTWDWGPPGRQHRELCHATNGGLGRKADWKWAWIGCWRHHDESGQVGVWTFAGRHELAVGDIPVATLMEAAARTHAAFLESALGLAWRDREAAGEPPPTNDLI